MTETPVPSPGTPHELLESVHDLTRRVRTAQRGTWFPLLVLGTVTLGAIPVDRFGPYAHTCQAVHTPAGPHKACAIWGPWSYVYWTAALILTYAVIAFFYVRRSRRRGLGTPIAPYIVAGLAIAAVVTAIGVWAALHPPGLLNGTLGLHLDPRSGLTTALYRMFGPASAIGLGLMVLSWVERNGALGVFALLYLTTALASVTFGWTISYPSPWFFLPHLVVLGTFLLLGSLSFALAQPAHRPTTDD